MGNYREFPLAVFLSSIFFFFLTFGCKTLFFQSSFHILIFVLAGMAMQSPNSAVRECCLAIDEVGISFSQIQKFTLLNDLIYYQGNSIILELKVLVFIGATSISCCILHATPILLGERNSYRLGGHFLRFSSMLRTDFVIFVIYARVTDLFTTDSHTLTTR